MVEKLKRKGYKLVVTITRLLSPALQTADRLGLGNGTPASPQRIRPARV